MSRPTRFEHIVTFNRTGRTVVQVRDHTAGYDLFVHAVGKRYCQWNRDDAPIPRNESLRACVRDALSVYRQEREREAVVAR